MIGHFGWRKVSLTKMIDAKMIGWKQNRDFLDENDRSFWWFTTVPLVLSGEPEIDTYFLFKI